MICMQKVIKTMDRLGYRENTKGTAYIRAAVAMVDADRQAMMCKDIYPGIARAYGDTPSRVERAMRGATEAAQRSPVWKQEWRELGGWNQPSNSEVIRRLARECGED